MNRKIILALLAGSFLLASFPASAHVECSTKNHRKSDYDVDLRGGRLYVEDGFDELMMIDNDGSLYVDGDEIDVSDKERRLLTRYVEEHEALYTEARNIARHGVKLGLGAAAGAVMLVLGLEDEDEFEAKTERDARRIEKAAEALCERIETIEDLEDELSERIPEFIPAGYESSVQISI